MTSSAGSTAKSGQRLFAFWKYDTYPYVLGAEVVEIKDSGRIVAKGYEGYASFKPILLLPLKEGEKRWAELKKLREEYKQQSEELRKLYTTYAEKILERETKK